MRVVQGIQAEQVVCESHEKCVDLLESGGEEDEGAIILTKGEYIFRLENFKESGKFTTSAQQGSASASAAGSGPVSISRAAS